MLSIKKSSLVISALAAILLTGTAQALPLLGVTVNNVGSQSAFDSNTLGYEFEALADTSVVSLGIWDNLSDGLFEAHEVGLWDSVGSLLASVTVAGGSSALLDSGFRWVDLAAGDIVQLVAGSTYSVGAYYDATNDDQVAVFSSITVDSRISYIESAQRGGGSSGSSLEFPSGTCCNSPLSSTHYYGGNIRLAEVPEPSILALFGAGLAGSGFARRRRIKM